MPSTPEILSNSVAGRPIAILTTNTNIHLTSTNKDQPTLFCSNPTAARKLLTLVINAVDIKAIYIEANSEVPIMEDHLLGGTASQIAARADATGMFVYGKNIEIT